MSKIAVLDLDDTLIDLKQSLIDAFNKEKNHSFHWTQMELFTAMYEFSHDEFKEIAMRHGVASIAKPYIFTNQFLIDLKLLGFYIVIVTARGGFMQNPYDFTESYLKEHNMVYDQLIVTNLGENKVDSLGEFDTIEFAMDDSVENCEHFVESCKFNYIFLPALPWNKTHPRGSIRIHNLYQSFHHMGIK